MQDGRGACSRLDTVCFSFSGVYFGGSGERDTRYCRGPKLYQLVIIGSAQSDVIPERTGFL